MDSLYAKIQHGYNNVRDQINVGDDHYNVLSDEVVRRLGEKNLSNTINILDAGCGNGYLLKMLQNKLSRIDNSNNIYFSGFDISDEMVKESIKRNPTVSHSVYALPDTDYNDKNFDYIACGEVLEHLYQPLSSLKELRRILVDDGEILVTVPNGDRIGIHTVLSNKKKFQPADDVLLTFSELNYLFRRAGLRPVRIQGYGGLFPILPRYSRTRQLCLRALTRLSLFKKNIPIFNGL